MKEKEDLNGEPFADDEFSAAMENIKNRVATEKYVGPGPTRREIKLKAKNRDKNKLAKKARRVQRKRK